MVFGHFLTIRNQCSNQWIISIQYDFFFFFLRTDSDSVSHFLLVNTLMSLFGSLWFVPCRWLPAGLPEKNRVHRGYKPTYHNTSRSLLYDPDYCQLSLVFFVCVCVSVYRVFPHLESELRFPLGPFPCSENSFPPSLFLQTPLLLPKPQFPVRSRQKLGLAFFAARELASSLLFLWGLVRVCRLKQSWSYELTHDGLKQALGV